MTVDLPAAVTFMTAHGRVLDRRRLALLLGTGGPGEVLGALAAYRNPDGGYGWGIEPDLRSPESQPVGATHALEVLVEAADAITAADRLTELLDWVQQHTLADGGLPFAVPLQEPTGSAPHWVSADPQASTLMMTGQVAAHAHRLARVRPEVAEHPWLATATAYCLDAIAGQGEAPQAYELMFALHFLDAAGPDLPDLDSLLDRLAPHIPADGVLQVGGGEVLRPLVLSPRPDGVSRRLFGPGVIDAELVRLVEDQQDDGGWTVDFPAYSPAAGPEWRGYATVGNLATLKAHGLLDHSAS